MYFKSAIDLSLRVRFMLSLEEIKSIFDSEERMDEVLFTALNKKKKEIAVKVRFQRKANLLRKSIIRSKRGSQKAGIANRYCKVHERKVWVR